MKAKRNNLKYENKSVNVDIGVMCLNNNYSLTYFVYNSTAGVNYECRHNYCSSDRLQHDAKYRQNVISVLLHESN